MKQLGKRQFDTATPQCLLLLFVLRCNFLKFTHETSCFGSGVSSASLADQIKFNDIQPSFAQFQAGDQAVFSVYFVGQLALSESRLFPHLHKHFMETSTLT